MSETQRPKAKLYQYVAFLRPTEDEEKRGEIGKVIVQPTTILSISDKRRLSWLAEQSRRTHYEHRPYRGGGAALLTLWHKLSMLLDNGIRVR